MPLDPQVRALLDEAAALGLPPLSQLSVEENRENRRRRAALAGAPEPVARVEERVVPGPGGDLPVRIYTPTGAGPFPILVFFHGGGWVVADLDTHDALCRTLANGGGCVVVSVAYRLAPEHRYPAAAEDAYAATAWVAAHAATIEGDAARLAVGGDSAGGNLAAVACLMARDRGGPALAFQLLIYPVTDHYEPGTPSYRENAEGYMLSRDDMIWFWDRYLARAEEAAHPYAAPLRAPDLRGLPPALVLTAEFDPLRDEGEAYAARLRQAGVPAELRRQAGLIHGYATMAGVLDAARRANAETAAALRTALSASS
jgi:acetyl esterase